MDTRERPRLVAARLRAWLEQRLDAPLTPALDVDRLADALELDVAPFHPAAQPPGTLGFLEPGEDLIFLRADLAEPIRRFTLAHEIGHALLHRATGSAAAIARSLLLPTSDASEADAAVCGEEDLEAPLDALGMEDEQLHPGQAYSARSRREMEANAFAAALLLPTAQLRDAYLQPSAPEGEPPTARALAERFGVSEDVALRQLSTLLLTDETPRPAAASAGRGTPVLDPSQRAAATVQAPALVVAGPGTGKTSTLVGRIAYLVREQGIAPSRLLALTFSNKAAREMRERVTALLAESAETQETPTICTIHAFCGELLRRYAPLVGLRPDFRLVTVADGYFLLREVCASLDLEYYQPLAAPAQFFPELLAAISRAKDELAGPEDYATAATCFTERAASEADREAAARASEVALVYTAYQRALEARGDPDFGDVVRLAVRLLQEHPDILAEVRAQYDQILVDEFQDINRAMGVLLRTLAGDSGMLWAVGDADQAIYRFRGASPANLTRFEEDYPTAHLCRLERNYRSLPPIVEAAAAVASAFLGGGERTPLAAVRASETAQAKGAGGQTPILTLAAASNDSEELAGLTDAIQRILASGRQPSDLAVLCRTRRLAQRIAAALREADIPIRVAAPLLEQDEIRAVLAVVRLLAESSGAGLLRAGALAAHPFSQADARALLAEARAHAVAPLRLLTQETPEVPGLSPEGAHGLARLAAVLTELRQVPDVATGLGRYIFSLTSLGRDVLAGCAAGDAAARERAFQLGRLLALARAYEDQRRGALPPAAARTHGATWTGFLEYLRVLVVLRQGIGGEDDPLASGADGVAVLTVHGSKGLEFPIVFLPGLAAQQFPLRRPWDAAPLPPDLRAKESSADTSADARHLTEEACLFYVALTRARDALVLSAAARYGRVSRAPSPFLTPILQRLDGTVARERWHAPAPRPVRPDHSTDESPRPAEEPIAIAEIETYLRCPRQYAYRYLYGLRGREGAVGALWRGLRETLEELRGQPTEGAATAPDQTSIPPRTLAEAQSLFERHWAATLGEDTSERDELSHQVLLRQGRRIIEREWQALTRARHPAGPVSEQPMPRVEYGRQVDVRAGGREIRLPVDRVELPATPAEPERAQSRAEEAAPPTPAATIPVRLVRQRLGGAKASPDVRALLYTLAADQHAASGQRAQAVQRRITSDSEEGITLSARQEQRLREELSGALQGLEEGRYPARPDPHTCAGCPFLLICPA